jgi:hypothetical protein
MKVSEQYFEDNRRVIGKDGWEMCGIAHGDKSFFRKPGRTYWFKRPLLHATDRERLS